MFRPVLMARCCDGCWRLLNVAYEEPLCQLLEKRSKLDDITVTHLASVLVPLEGILNRMLSHV
jgi:hypothetical protein